MNKDEQRFRKGFDVMTFSHRIDTNQFTAKFDGQGSGVVIAGHFHETDSYSIYRPRGMSDCLITYTLDGEGIFITSTGEQRCKAGDVTILKAGIPHRYRTQKGRMWHFVWAHFPPTEVETNLLPDDEVVVQTIDNESTRKRIYRAFKRVLSDSRERGDYWHALCINSIREILLLCERRGNQRLDARIEETLHLLSRRMREPIRVETLGRMVGLSPSRLAHLFKDNTGMTLIEALNDMRIREAALLLEYTDRGAAEVAYDVGYHNYNHFINQFRKRYGVSPSVFAKSRRTHS
jgi:AraC family transcriptional regulator of arabinose operon